MSRRLPRLVALSTTGLLFVGGVAAAAAGTNALSPTLGANRDATPLVTTTTTTTTAPTPDATTTADTDSESLSVDEICAQATNHGEAVSAIAHDKDNVGAEHGAAVSAMAKRDCGKDDEEVVEPEATDDEDQTLEEFCAEVKNHGQAVSKLAKKKDNVGAEHGAAVSERAKSDCGKPHANESSTPQGS